MSAETPLPDVVIRVDGVSKRFSHTPERARRPGAKDVLKAMLGLRSTANDRSLRPDEFWAVKNVSFELRRGEALGIVGLNGAGKSTLLKILLGRLKPDEGTIRVFGKAGGLIELGAGFHPEMSGRRNIFLSASLLGIGAKEAEAAMGDIIEFADIGRFIDAPVKTYSSGMKVRLGFAVAVHFVPDVVICDEVLAVGDFEFRQKCLQRIKEIRRTRSIILVSHGLGDISLFCNRAMLLHQGECILIGSPEDVLRVYAECSKTVSAEDLRRRTKDILASERRSASRSNAAAGVSRATVPQPLAPLAPAFQEPVADQVQNGPKTPEIRDGGSLRRLFGPEYSNKEAITAVELRWSFARNEKGYYIVAGDAVHIQLSFELLRPVERFRIGLPVFNETGLMVLGPDSRSSNDISEITSPGKYLVNLSLDPLPLNTGRFCPVISICDDPAHLYRRHLPFFEVLNPTHEFGVAKTESAWSLGRSSLPLELSSLDAS